MKKKTKDKQASRHEGATVNYLPPSPPAQQKLPQEAHFQSSSSPVGRPPPLFMDHLGNTPVLDELTDARDHAVFQDFDAFLAAQEAPSVSSPIVNPCFILMNQQQMDFDLSDLLCDDSQDTMLDYEENNLFPALPDNTSG
ncbi:uncharacterized protein B0P05DRAFT_527542 [Gilbertella persicaria]|uniref:Uncharacterized protein n=1 Tax=Rhizopus stolonifer TaxID=4846 RepID=A0A367KPG9_RHIST|nr:uncharacterized protein B0P05DRAFT_527542 [Gilbertella persicaria]KAI8091445.1 hypothetical protein B0P05DRAFT_527542 [Gilbertella persicaria]RCI04135.1 hypothetical protein CU098_011905 [Rhizopus stolonifer]